MWTVFAQSAAVAKLKTVADKSKAPPGKRRGLPRWARLLLCVAFVPVVLLGPLVVIGLWPGLDFEVVLTKPTPASSGWSIRQIHEPHTRDYLSINCGLVGFGWDRQAKVFPSHMSRGLGRRNNSRVHAIGWFSDHHAVVFWRRVAP